MRKRRARKALLPVEDYDFDLRLAASVVAFVNGQNAREAFSWVVEAQRLRVQRAGLASSAAEWRDTDWEHIGASNLRWRFRFTSTAQFGTQYADPALHASPRLIAGMDELYSDQIKAVQIVTRWKLEGGSIHEYSIPRLDSVERCIAYVLGLAMLNRHGLRHAIKRCLFRKSPDELHHFFMDIPTTKREFCCDQHAQTHRQRVKRARDARRHK
jgi:hypothetical protein